MKSKTCCFTGHRILSAEQSQALAGRIERAVRLLYARGVCYFGAGGALGFDMLAAETVLRLREEMPALRLILVLPCRDQAGRFPASQRARYEAILRQADKIVYTADTYAPGCMHLRNRHLADESAYCLCYLTSARGGTKYTVDYCMAHGVKVCNLALGDLSSDCFFHGGSEG